MNRQKLKWSTQWRQALRGHAHSPASRHIDLLHTDWLQTRWTRSHSSEHVYSSDCSHFSSRCEHSQWDTSAQNNFAVLNNFAEPTEMPSVAWTRGAHDGSPDLPRQTSIRLHYGDSSVQVHAMRASEVRGWTYGRRGAVEAGAAVVARERGAVDDVVFTAGASEAGPTIALVAANTDVPTYSAVQTRRVSRAVVQVYTQSHSHRACNTIITQPTYWHTAHLLSLQWLFSYYQPRSKQGTAIGRVRLSVFTLAFV